MTLTEDDKESSVVDWNDLPEDPRCGFWGKLIHLADYFRDLVLLASPGFPQHFEGNSRQLRIAR